jgi:hypothetical protein
LPVPLVKNKVGPIRAPPVVEVIVPEPPATRWTLPPVEPTLLPMTIPESVVEVVCRRRLPFAPGATAPDVVIAPSEVIRSVLPANVNVEAFRFTAPEFWICTSAEPPFTDNSEALV